MGLFKKKTKDMPIISKEKFEPVVRCSICSGEQVLCARDRQTRELHELMLLRSFADLEAFCDANGLDPDEVEKIY